MGIGWIVTRSSGNRSWRPWTSSSALLGELLGLQLWLVGAVGLAGGGGETEFVGLDLGVGGWAGGVGWFGVGCGSV